MRRNNFINILVIMILLLSSCTKVQDSLAKSWLLDMKPPPGPPEYQAAWVDGCAAAIGESRWNMFAPVRAGLYMHPVYSNKSNLYRSFWRSRYIWCGLWIPYFWRNNASFLKPSFTIKSKGHPWSARRSVISKAPPGPKKFRIGWKDGCGTGKAATGKTKHRLYYKFVKDPKYIVGDGWDPEYQKGWETAFWYCQRYYDIYESPSRRNLL